MIKCALNMLYCMIKCAFNMPCCMIKSALNMPYCMITCAIYKFQNASAFKLNYVFTTYANASMWMHSMQP